MRLSPGRGVDAVSRPGGRMLLPGQGGGVCDLTKGGGLSPGAGESVTRPEGRQSMLNGRKPAGGRALYVNKVK